MGILDGIEKIIGRRKAIFNLNKKYQNAYINNDINRLLRFRVHRFREDVYLLIEIQNEENLTLNEKEEIAQKFVSDLQLTRSLYINGFTGYGIQAKSNLTFSMYKFIL